MKKISKTQVWLGALLVLLMACNQTPPKATITITNSLQHEAVVKISQYLNLDQSVLAESRIDSLGNCKLELVLDTPIFALLQVGKNYREIYLTPETDLTITNVDGDYQSHFKFSGDGADINNYNTKLNSIVNSFKQEKLWTTNEYATFSKQHDSLKTILSTFYKKFTDSLSLTEAEQTMFESRMHIQQLALIEEFKFFNLNTLLTKKWQAKRNKQDYLHDEVPGEFRKQATDLLLDPSLLTHGEYQSLLNLYWRNYVDIPIAEQILLSGDPIDSTSVKSYRVIEQGNYPEALREFLLAFDLQNRLVVFGITPETDRVFNKFKNTYHTSAYLPGLTKIYSQWQALASGNPAPDFEGLTREGKKVSLSDLRGKVVYIDVWATWCVPCVAEIPASQKLQADLAHEERIQFLNVSTDTNQDAWKSFLERNPAWLGQHIVLESNQRETFGSTYKLNGVPAYILVDPAGNIVTVKAPRPSEANVKEAILEALATEK